MRLHLVILSIIALSCSIAQAFDLYFDHSLPQLKFVSGELAKHDPSLKRHELSICQEKSPSFRIIILQEQSPGIPKWLEHSIQKGPELSAQGFSIHKLDPYTICVVGFDEIGALYGGLDIAEQLRINNDALLIKRITPGTSTPAIERRGIKFNIPLDVRTPSYDDTGDAAQENITEMWNFSFWTEFLDQMARDRYNVLTLWNDHPFPSLVKIPEFPDVALDNVCVGETLPTWKTPNWEEFRTKLRIVHNMSIDDKITFWRKVLRYAKDRGISVYWITWNVKTNGVGGKYGITPKQDNPETIKYMRASVRELLLTYPLLAGIGTTAGENMMTRDDEFAREKWLWNTYGEGILDAKKQQPERSVHFIHRVWYSGMEEMKREFLDKYPDPIDISFKYAQARLYATHNPPWSKDLLPQLQYENAPKSWWNLRNDDIYVFRWGDADYVRDFIKHFPKEQTAGYYMGSDGYVWGREFTDLSPDSPRQLEIHKHWYSFMLWGRLGYDPDLDPKRLEKIIHDRFPNTDAAAFMTAWSTASQVIPLINRFHYRSWDHMWTPEGCLSKGGFHDVIDFIQMFPIKDGGIMGIQQYTKFTLAGTKTKATTPEDVAEQLESLAAHVLAYLHRSTRPEEKSEFTKTLCDMEAIAHLANYYASKIRGATSLAFYLQEKDLGHQNRSIEYLTEAQLHAVKYTTLASSLYKPQLLARTRDLDWNTFLADAEKDIAIAKNPQPTLEFKKANSDLKRKE